MNSSAFRHDFRQALQIVWLITGVVCGAAVVFPVLLPASVLLSAFPMCAAKAAGSACSFCGMTTAFVSIGVGDLSSAQRANAGAVPLYAALSMNFAIAVAYTIMRVKRHANS